MYRFSRNAEKKIDAPLKKGQVIVRIFAGLGNQMFQYAAAKALAVHHGVAVKADLRWFDQVWQEETPREYGLDFFALSLPKASSEEIFQHPCVHLFRSPWIRGGTERVYRKIQLFCRTEKLRTYRETRTGFDKDFFSLPSTVYLLGYFQSAKYFSSIAKELRQDFSLRNKNTPFINSFYNVLSSENAVCVHIRRGDYVTSQRAARHHGVCSVSYYREAMCYIRGKIQAPHFYLFSDDFSWVSQQFPQGEDVTYVHNAIPRVPQEELFLMSCCSHHIIANSSFSWWGAWLGLHDGQIVIAPKQWTKTPLDHGDLFLGNWVLL